MLFCDIGNTSYHFYNDVTGENFKKSVKEYKPDHLQEKVYYICVHKEIKKSLLALENWIDVEVWVDRENYYETMGIDRIVACKAIDHGIIVDAGSAITVDLLKDGVFEGGFIYPGMQAMAKTYENISTELAYSFNFELDLGKMAKNSKDAISYGYLKLLHTEVVSHNMPIFLTGGDAKKFAKIFPQAKVDEMLIFSGMKKIILKAEKC